LTEYCEFQVQFSVHSKEYQKEGAIFTVKNGSVTLTQVGLSKLQLHYQIMCKQVDQKKLQHCKSQASVNNGGYNQGSYYRNATSAAALVQPLTL